MCTNLFRICIARGSVRQNGRSVSKYYFTFKSICGFITIATVSIALCIFIFNLDNDLKNKYASNIDYTFANCTDLSLTVMRDQLVNKMNRTVGKELTFILIFK